MDYDLFGRLADRFDWHTPPSHYQHDHAFVLNQIGPSPGRVLDAGCGTGVFLEKALRAGVEAYGFDSSPQMVALAAGRVGRERVWTGRMQDLEDEEKYDAVVSLSWSLNYLRSWKEAADVLRRFHSAMRPGGRLVLQVAHAPNATGALGEDREDGPEGQPEDIVFLYRFSRVPGRLSHLRAQYIYGCRSRREMLCEEHYLRAADARGLQRIASQAGFRAPRLLDSWRGEPLAQSVSAFLLARRGD